MRVWVVARAGLMGPEPVSAHLSMQGALEAAAMCCSEERRRLAREQAAPAPVDTTRPGYSWIYFDSRVRFCILGGDDGIELED